MTVAAPSAQERLRLLGLVLAGGDLVTRKISARDAVGILRHTSQTTNRKVREIAAKLIETMTGHPPYPPRPLTQRD